MRTFFGVPCFSMHSTNRSATYGSRSVPCRMASFSSSSTPLPILSMYTFSGEEYGFTPRIALASLPPIPFLRDSSHSSRLIFRVSA